MTLNPDYMISPNLQEYFVDKSTGFPLAQGVVTYYSDVNRTTLKPVYQLSGSGSSPTYTQLPNPMTLTNVGTTSDGSGNDVRVYYYPYDANGNVENYYITVVSAGGTPQITRVAWPNLSSGGEAAEEVLNFIPNPQFLAHNNIPATPTTVAGQITQPITTIAQGGWTFERPSGSTATDIVTFYRFSPTTSPTGNPRYGVRINTTVSGSDTYKNLCLKFADVNTFSSNTNYYTLYFEGITNSGSSTPIVFTIYKNFGTGGSAPVVVSGTTFTIPNSYTQKNFSFIFGSNTGKTIISDDDFLQLVFTFPLSSGFDVTLTNFVLTDGQTTITAFPEDTNTQVFSQAISGSMPTPAYDGSNLYLPMVLTPSGVQFLNSNVGKLFASTTGIVEIDELAADGTGYVTNSVNATSKIPYSRIQAKYWNNSTNTPKFGTGSAYVMTYILAGDTAQLFMTTNTPGVVTSPADGSTATNFTFENVHLGTSTGWGVNSFVYNGGIWLVTSAVNQFTTYTQADTSTFSAFAFYKDSIATGFSALKTATSAGAGLAGLYWRFNVTAQKYVWYTVSHSGSDPAPGGTGIEIDLTGAETAQDVAMVTASAVMGYQGSYIICNAASTVAAGSYFTFNTLTQLYVVWYKKNGSGTQPVVSNAVYLEVDILSTDTAAVVATKTQAVINSYYVAVPDARGLFLRGQDPTPEWDPDTASRFCGVNYTNTADNIGTIEIDELYYHVHTTNFSDPGHQHTFPGGGHLPAVNTGWTVGANSIGGGATNIAQTGAASVSDITQTNSATTSISVSVNYTGFNETRPVNMSVLWVVKY